MYNIYVYCCRFIYKADYHQYKVYKGPLNIMKPSFYAISFQVTHAVPAGSAA